MGAAYPCDLELRSFPWIILPFGYQEPIDGDGDDDDDDDDADDCGRTSRDQVLGLGQGNGGGVLGAQIHACSSDSQTGS
jgi:hypothetical protein